MKLPGKALFYRDWKYSKWFVPLISFEMFLIFFVPAVLSERYGRALEFNPFSAAGNYIALFLLVFPTVILMSLCLFYYDRKLTCCSLSACMPFSRDEIITCKWVVGLYNIVLSYLSIYVLMNAALIFNFCWGRLFPDITKWFILCLTVTICFFGFVVLLQSFSGSAVVGSIMTLLLAAAPFSILYSIYGIFNIHYTSARIPRILEPFLVKLYWENVYTKINSIKLNIPESLVILILGLGLTCVFYFLSLKLFKKTRLEMTGCLTAIRGADKLYRIVLSYYAGFFLLVLYNLVFQRSAFRPDILVLCCIILPIPLYFVTGKAIRIYNKRAAR